MTWVQSRLLPKTVNRRATACLIPQHQPCRCPRGPGSLLCYGWARASPSDAVICPRIPKEKKLPVHRREGYRIPLHILLPPPSLTEGRMPPRMPRSSAVTLVPAQTTASVRGAAVVTGGGGVGLEWEVRASAPWPCRASEKGHGSG